MPETKPFDTVLAAKAEEHGLSPQTLLNAVREELAATVAREIVKQILAGEVTAPPMPKGGTWGRGGA